MVNNPVDKIKNNSVQGFVLNWGLAAIFVAALCLLLVLIVWGIVWLFAEKHAIWVYVAVIVSVISIPSGLGFAIDQAEKDSESTVF